MLVKLICFLIIFNTLGVKFSNIYIKKNIEKISYTNDIEKDTESNEKDNTIDDLEKNLFYKQIVSFQKSNFIFCKKNKTFPELSIFELKQFDNILIPPPKLN